jgi:ATP-dependent DNA ligase
MGPIRLSPMTCDLSLARKWFHMGVGLDGIIAKREDLSYQSGKRTGMEKIKKQRTADCVVGGFRYLEKKKLVGSLLLGLYNDQGLLDHVGFTSSIRNEDRQQLTKKLETMVKPPGFTGKAPGGLSRWSTKHSMEWKPVQPNSWPKFSSITSPADDFATERSSCAGGLKKIRAVAP